jgi:hypothetical protein
VRSGMLVQDDRPAGRAVHVLLRPVNSGHSETFIVGYLCR